MAVGGRRVTIATIAEAAGVSVPTVSRVLNGHPNVKEQTRLRVRAAIAELGYRPNRAARALVTGRSQLIGVWPSGTSCFGSRGLALFSGKARSAAMSTVAATAPG